MSRVSSEWRYFILPVDSGGSWLDGGVGLSVGDGRLLKIRGSCGLAQGQEQPVRKIWIKQPRDLAWFPIAIRTSKPSRPSFMQHSDHLVSGRLEWVFHSDFFCSIVRLDFFLFLLTNSAIVIIRKYEPCLVPRYMYMLSPYTQQPDCLVGQLIGTSRTRTIENSPSSKLKWLIQGSFLWMNWPNDDSV